MRQLGSVLIALLFFALALIVLVAVLGLALRLIVVVVVLGLAAIVYFFAEALIGKGR